MKQKLHALSTAVAVTALAMVLGGCAGSPETPATGGGGVEDLGSVTYLGFASSPLNTIERLAIEKGFFADHGLQVEFASALSGAEMSAALLGGSAQFGSTGLPATAPLVAAGECFTNLAAGPLGFYDIIAGADVDLPNKGESYPDNIRDLKGGRIGLNAVGTAAQLWTELLLEGAGVDPSEVTFIAVGGSSTAVTALLENQVDFLLSYPPNEQVLQPDEYQKVADLVNTPGDPLDNLLMTTMGTTCDYANENPEIVSAFCSGVTEAYTFANDEANRDEMIEFVGTILEVDPDAATEIWDQYAKIYAGGPVIDEVLWEEQQSFISEDTPLPTFGEAVASC